MLDELLLGGEVQETSKKNVLKAIAAQDLLQEVSFLLHLKKMQYTSSNVAYQSNTNFCLNVSVFKNEKSHGFSQI